MAAIRRAFDIAELQEEVAQLREHVNNQADMEALEAEVRELRQNIPIVSPKGIYRNSQIHFLMWLLNNQRDFKVMNLLPRQISHQRNGSLLNLF